ncbi:hypothetical protein ABK040_002714 [Willaertia magna]
MNNNNITFRSKSNSNLTQSNSSTSLNNNNSINNTTTTTLSPTIIPYIHQSKSNNELSSSPYSSSSFHINNHQINDIEMDTFHTIDNNNLINLSSDDHFLHNSSFQKDSMKLSLTSNDYIKNNNSDNNSSITTTNKNTHHKKSHHHNSESHRNSIESIRSNYSINGKDKLIIKSPTITTTKQKKIEIAKKIGKMVYTIFLLIILIILIVLDVITSPKNTWISRGSIVIAVVLFGRFLYEFLFEFIYEYILDHYLSDDLSNIVLDNNKV